MANELVLAELRREGFVPWVVEVRLTPILVRDLWSFGDVAAYDPTLIRRPRLVNACKEDVNSHIRDYKLGGIDKKTGKPYPANEHLRYLLHWFDCYIYSFVLRTFRKLDGKRSDRKVYQCRKWQGVVSPSGIVSFERQDETPTIDL